MSMYSKVLIPVDLAHTERIPAMLKSARSIVGNNKSQITLLHVVSEVPGFVVAQVPPSFHLSQKEDAGKALDALINEHGLKGDVKAIVKDGNAANTILKTAKDMNADVIIVGSHKPGPADYLIGSVAARVVRHANCSVIVIR